MIEAAFARLDARLETDVERPVAIALSGGGDSLALLDLATNWAKARGRRLLALNVDHGLSPQSGDWTDFAAEAAGRFGAPFRALSWTGDKPLTGLPAAARAARHRLLAKAARQAGAHVILLGHTADDIAEADWMRARGSTLGRVAEWAPSPVWPEGRSLALLRPLLGVSRAALRDHLTARGLPWIDDPANDDPRFARARARQSLVGTAAPPPKTTPPVPAEMTVDAFGVIRAPRRLDLRDLALAVVCAAGGERPPRGPALAALSGRLAAPGDVVAVLGGARIEATGDALTLYREAGEFARRPPGLIDGVWDGRFELNPPNGFSVAPAAGVLSRLSDADRARLATLPAGVRPTMPVLIRNESGAPILAGEQMGLRTLVADRLALAQGRLSQESALARPSDGETPHEGLSWRGLDTRRAPDGPDREIERRNEPA
ncbi:MAG: tRNA lysidine(34) synthetase TilS [Brevundimonas sp.]|nr:MAG: tRNA lysidine(34) synthetase TilS [Brevundimonas sp.]